MNDLQRRRQLERLSKPELITKVIEVEQEMHARELHHFEEAHAKPLSTSPEPVKDGADSLHVTPTDEREARDQA